MLERKLNKVLFLTAIALIIIMTFGTAVALVTQKNSPSDSWRRADPEPQKVMNMSRRSGEALDAYTHLGQIRAVTKAPSDEERGTLVIISPWFSYPAGDTVLFEELSQKERQAKAILTEYFASHTARELLSMGENSVKAELLDLINGQLVLGKIRAIYFNEYVFFD